ncbi:MAG: caspase family protein [Ardenticatenaceae bacterium]
MSCKISWLTPPSRALIVGINEYDVCRIPNLRGCVKDGLEMGSFLLKELGMKPDQIAVLTSPPYKRGNRLLSRHTMTKFLDHAPTPDEVRLLKRGTVNATRANIIKGIREFLGGAEPGEEVLFYYSGHGSTNKLTEEIRFGDEQGETLVPADAGFKLDQTTDSVEETFHILDRELRVLIAELLEKRIGLTVIADSCHSGGISRGIMPDRMSPVRSLSNNNGDEEQARFTQPNHTPRDLASLLNGTVEAETLKKLYTGPALPHTLIAGCLPDQLSYEVKGQDGRYRGAMTLALLQTFRSANGPISYRELGRALRANVPEHYNKNSQHPQITGKQEHLIFSPEDEEVPRKAPLFAVVKVKNGCIELDGGQIEGINKNSVLTCYADWSLTRPLGEWKVSKSLPNSARAAPLKDTEPMMVKPGQPLTLDTSPERPKVLFSESAQEIAEAWRNRSWGNQKPEELSEESWDDDFCLTLSDKGSSSSADLKPEEQDSPPTLSDKGSSSSADLKPEEQDSRPTLSSSDWLTPIKSNQEQAPSKGACSSLSGLDPNQDGAQDDKPSSIIDSSTEQKPLSEEIEHDWTLSNQGLSSSGDFKPEEEDSRPTVSTQDDKPSSIIDSSTEQKAVSEEIEHDWTLSNQGLSSSADFKPEEEDSRPTVSTQDDKPSSIIDSSAEQEPLSEEILDDQEQAPAEGALHNSLLWGLDANEEGTDYNPMSKGAPYLVETFTGNADYTVEVKDRMLLVRGPDNTILEALRHKIQTNEEARRTTDPRKRRGAHDLAFLMDRVICYHDFVAKAPDEKNELTIRLSGEEPEIKVTVERRFKDIEITVRNQNHKAKPVHVNLYRLDPDEYIAERIWPADATDQLPWGASSSTSLPRQIGQKALLHFKLFVSTTPLMLEKWPCGKPHKNRGATMASVRVLKPRFQGWTTYNFEVELP